MILPLKRRRLSKQGLPRSENVGRHGGANSSSPRCFWVTFPLDFAAHYMHFLKNGTEQHVFLQEPAVPPAPGCTRAGLYRLQQ